MGPFAQYAERLLENGFSPLPLSPDTGLPAIKRWNRLRFRFFEIGASHLHEVAASGIPAYAGS
jgi:hypothetical protein